MRKKTWVLSSALGCDLAGRVENRDGSIGLLIFTARKEMEKKQYPSLSYVKVLFSES